MENLFRILFISITRNAIDGRILETILEWIGFLILGCLGVCLIYYWIKQLKIPKCKHGNREICYFCEEEAKHREQNGDQMNIEEVAAIKKKKWLPEGFDMKKDLIRFLGIVVIIIVFSLLIYPTPIHYSMFSGKIPVKTNWITGKTWIFTGSEWKETN